MRKRFHHLSLFRRKVCKPPHGTIGGPGNDADKEYDFQGVRYHGLWSMRQRLACPRCFAKSHTLRSPTNVAKATITTMDKINPNRVLDAAIENTGNRTIVLVGLMGAGKTSIGRRLADKMGLSFVDADTEIEKAAGKSIPDIFTDHGEAHFRDGERRVIARLLENGKQVLATGGGAFMNPETREAIKSHALSVWLKADLEVLLKRVAKRGGRPLLENRDPAEVLQNLINLRYPVYAEADITVESLDVQHAQMVHEVLKALAGYRLQKDEIQHG
jgi:shikimate kinase